MDEVFVADAFAEKIVGDVAGEAFDAAADVDGGVAGAGGAADGHAGELVHHAVEEAAVLGESELGLAAGSDVALGAPGTDEGVVGDDAGEAVEKNFLSAVAGGLMALDVDQAVAGRGEEGAEEGAVARFGGIEELGDGGAGELGGAEVAVGLGHGVVALGDVGVGENVLNLLLDGQVEGDRRAVFDAPDGLGALLDEGAVAFFAGGEGGAGGVELGGATGDEFFDEPGAAPLTAQE